MAKVYSWEVKRNPRTYAYIIHPDSVTYVSDKAVSTANPKAYIGSELKGTRLQKIIDWVQNPENDYETQFQIMVNTCANDERAQNAVFDTASSYIDLPGTCDLRGPAGRGIESVRYSHSINGESVYIIKYDDGAEDSFSVRDGKDGKDGIDGAPGAKGDTGISSKFMMVYTTGKNDEGELITPKRPEGGSYDFLTGKASYPEGWAPNDSGVIPPVWMSSRTFTTSELSTDPEWSIPVQITGENGAPGVDGVSTEFIYKRTTVKPTEVGQLPSENTNGYVPTDWGWTPSPLGVTENDPTEWCCLRKMVKDVGWGPWDGPTIWSQYGVNGQDGDGVQYIYMRNKGELPKNPTPFGWDDPTSAYQDKLLEWAPAIGSYSNYKGEPVTITEEYYWSDNPQDVDAKYQYQWVAVRKYRKGDNGEQMWQPFSNPTLWGKFGQNGDNGTSVRTLYALSTSTSNYPTPPEGTTATGDWGSGFPKDYEFGVNVVWGITAELWSHNNEFVDPETGWSEPFLVTGVKGKDGDAINYNSRYFAYGWVDSTPYPLSSTDPDNPGTSLDGKGRSVVWRDYPDTKNIGSDNDERRWYQCDVHINGNTQQIEKYGPVLPCNGRDGSATPGRYTEFRFAVTPTDDEPILVQFNDDGLIIREPKLFNENQTEQWGWFTFDKELPELKPGGAVWEIWATIDGATEEVIIQSDGSGWSGPLRVSGERGQQGIQGPTGLRGVTGIPGAMINPMYCLGTKGRQEKGESFFENGDGYFGSDLWKDDVLPEALTGWYKTPPYSDFLDATSTTEVNSYASITNNVGRVVRYITTKENSGVTEVYYTYYLIENLNTIKEIKKDVLQQDELNIYIWCTQGKDIWKAGTVGKEEEGDTVQHERIGVDWGDPFRLQGTNGLRGLAGNRGQVVYPMGIYNEEEVYITTDAKAPYVYDPDDGLFYVYNVVGKPWVGKLPTDYKNIKIDKNGKADDGAEYYKYSMDGTYGNWIGDQNGDTPGKNFANHTDKGSTPAWVRFESFQALYTSIGIIANGMIGSAVYNNEFMFSQQGLAADGKTFSTDYEKFLDGYKYDEKGKTENGETKHWYYKGTTNYISDREVNPYETKPTTDSTCIHGFQPNVCINFATGQMWLQCGKLQFGATSSNVYTSSEVDTQIDKKVSAATKSLSDALDNFKEDIQGQSDGYANTYYQDNDPSEEWTTDDTKNHVGDLWYDTGDKRSYIFASGSLSDTNLGKESANSNLTTYHWATSDVPESVYDAIDGRSKIFISEPEPPYHTGDLWFVHNNNYIGSTFYDNTTGITSGTCMVCMIPEENSTMFSTSHWAKRDHYADEAQVKNAQDELDAMNSKLNDWASDLKIGPTERTELKREMDSIQAEYPHITAQTTTLGITFTGYTTAYENVINVLTYYTDSKNADENGCIDIVTGTTSTTKGYGWIKNYYEERQELLQAISDKLNEKINNIPDTSWLESVFGSGTTEFYGGAVLSNFLGVKNSSGNISAFLNGSHDDEEFKGENDSILMMGIGVDGGMSNEIILYPWICDEQVEDGADPIYTLQDYANSSVASNIKNDTIITAYRINGNLKFSTSEPTHPYYAGDLWIVHNDNYQTKTFYNNTTGITSGTCMVCMTSSNSTDGFKTTHWSKKTDNILLEASGTFYLKNPITDSSATVPVSDEPLQTILRVYSENGDNRITYTYDRSKVQPIIKENAVKLTPTRIYSDGTIIAKKLISSDSEINGTINADGIFTGEVQSQTGSLKNYSISNSHINNTTLDLYNKTSDSINVFDENSKLKITISGNELTDFSKQTLSLPPYKVKYTNKNGTDAGQWYGTDNQWETAFRIAVNGEASITIPPLIMSTWIYTSGAKKCNNISYGLRVDARSNSRVSSGTDTTSETFDIVYLKQYSEVSPYKSENNGGFAYFSGQTETTKINVPDWTDYIVVQVNWKMHLHTYAWLGMDKSAGEFSISLSDYSAFTIEYGTKQDGLEICSNGLRMITNSGETIFQVTSSNLLAEHKGFGICLGTIPNDNNICIRMKFDDGLGYRLVYTENGYLKISNES